MEKYNLWARVGMTFNIDEDNIAEFKSDPEAYMIKGLEDGTVRIDGETYFPEEDGDNERFEDKHGYIGWG